MHGIVTQFKKSQAYQYPSIQSCKSGQTIIQSGQKIRSDRIEFERLPGLNGVTNLALNIAQSLVYLRKCWTLCGLL
jgi:hypothetical protein